MIGEGAMVHALALAVECSIGARTRVWQFASIIRGAKVGEDCNIASAAIIDGAELGDRCLVGHGSSINPGFKAGNDVFIGPNVTCCNDRWPRADKEGFAVERFIEEGMVTVMVEDGASIGAGAVVLPGVVIGAGAMIAAGVTVDRNVPPCHLFKRSGRIVPIEPGRKVNRMRAAIA